jgi:hypothetical protein
MLMELHQDVSSKFVVTTFTIELGALSWLGRGNREKLENRRIEFQARE